MRRQTNGHTNGRTTQPPTGWLIGSAIAEAETAIRRQAFNDATNTTGGDVIGPALTSIACSLAAIAHQLQHRWPERDR